MMLTSINFELPIFGIRFLGKPYEFDYLTFLVVCASFSMIWFTFIDLTMATASLRDSELNPWDLRASTRAHAVGKCSDNVKLLNLSSI